MGKNWCRLDHLCPVKGCQCVLDSLCLNYQFSVCFITKFGVIFLEKISFHIAVFRMFFWDILDELCWPLISMKISLYSSSSELLGFRRVEFMSMKFEIWIRSWKVLMGLMLNYAWWASTWNLTELDAWGHKLLCLNYLNDRYGINLGHKEKG